MEAVTVVSVISLIVIGFLFVRFRKSCMTHRFCLPRSWWVKICCKKEESDTDSSSIEIETRPPTPRPRRRRPPQSRRLRNIDNATLRQICGEFLDLPPPNPMENATVEYHVKETVVEINVNGPMTDQIDQAGPSTESSSTYHSVIQLNDEESSPICTLKSIDERIVEGAEPSTSEAVSLQTPRDASMASEDSLQTPRDASMATAGSLPTSRDTSMASAETSPTEQDFETIINIHQPPNSVAQEVSEILTRKWTYTYGTHLAPPQPWFFGTRRSFYRIIRRCSDSDQSGSRVGIPELDCFTESSASQTSLCNSNKDGSESTSFEISTIRTQLSKSAPLAPKGAEKGGMRFHQDVPPEDF